MFNQCLYLTREGTSLVAKYKTYISLSELQSKIKQGVSNLRDAYDQYIASYDVEKCAIIEEWYKAYLIEQELEALQTIPAARAAEYNAAKVVIDRLENGYITSIGTKTNPDTGVTEPDIQRTYLEEGNYYPWLKYFRGDAKYTKPVYESENYKTLYELNSIANRLNNPELIVFNDTDISVIRKYYLNQLSIIREELRYQGFTYNSLNFCADRVVQNDISSIVLQYTINMIPEDFQYTWKIRTGEYYTFNGKTEILAFSAQLVGFINACFRQEETAASRVKLMTLDELKNIDLRHEFLKAHN